MAATVWANVQVDIHSALAAAVPITGITAASPGVVSHSGTDPSDGDFVVLPDLEGMSKLRDRISRVANQVVGAFDVEGIDTTAFGAFTAGGFQLITFGTTISTFTDVNASGGERDFKDASVIHDDLIREIPVGVSPLDISFESLFDLGSPALLSLKAFSDNGTKIAVRITFENGNIVVFYGFVTASGLPTGSTRDVVKTSISIKASGAATGYAA